MRTRARQPHGSGPPPPPRARRGRSADRSLPLSLSCFVLSISFFPLLSRLHRQWTAPPTRGLRCTPHATAVAIHRRRHGHTVRRTTRTRGTRGDKKKENGRAEEHKSREDVRCRWRGRRRQPAHAPTGRPSPDRPFHGNRRGTGGRGGGCQPPEGRGRVSPPHHPLPAFDAPPPSSGSYFPHVGRHSTTTCPAGSRRASSRVPYGMSRGSTSTSTDGGSAAAAASTSTFRR